MEAIKLIKTDHQAVEELFKKFEATGPKVETPLEIVTSGVSAFTSKAKEIGESAFTQLRDRVGGE